MYQKLCAFTLSTVALFITSTVVNAESAIRVACDEYNEGALIYINGKSKGACPIDLFVNAGEIQLKAVKSVDDTHEQLFEITFDLPEDGGKRINVSLSMPQLTTAAKELLATTALVKAKNGDIQAMKTISNFYNQGHGIEKNESEALFWRTKANKTEQYNESMAIFALAKAGDIPAMAEMARLYTEGVGIKQNHQQAKIWKAKEMAAKQAVLDKAAALVAAVQAKEDAAKNIKLENHAQSVLSRARYGDIEAMKEISALYKSGEGIEISHVQSQEWMIEAQQEEERKRLELELEELSYFGSTQVMIKAGQKTFDYNPLFGSTSIVPMVFSGVTADLVSTPYRLTKEANLKSEIEALAVNWGAPKSMVAKASQKQFERIEALIVSVE